MFPICLMCLYPYQIYLLSFTFQNLSIEYEKYCVFVIVSIRFFHRIQVFEVLINLHYVILTIAYNCRLYIAKF